MSGALLKRRLPPKQSAGLFCAAVRVSRRYFSAASAVSREPVFRVAFRRNNVDVLRSMQQHIPLSAAQAFEFAFKRPKVPVPVGDAAADVSVFPATVDPLATHTVLDAFRWLERTFQFVSPDTQAELISTKTVASARTANYDGGSTAPLLGTFADYVWSTFELACVRDARVARWMSNIYVDALDAATEQQRVHLLTVFIERVAAAYCASSDAPNDSHFNRALVDTERKFRWVISLTRLDKETLRTVAFQNRGFHMCALDYVDDN